MLASIWVKLITFTTHGKPKRYHLYAREFPSPTRAVRPGHHRESKLLSTGSLEAILPLLQLRIYCSARPAYDGGEVETSRRVFLVHAGMWIQMWNNIHRSALGKGRGEDVQKRLLGHGLGARPIENWRTWRRLAQSLTSRIWESDGQATVQIAFIGLKARFPRLDWAVKKKHGQWRQQSC